MRAATSRKASGRQWGREQRIPAGKAELRAPAGAQAQFGQAARTPDHAGDFPGQTGADVLQGFHFAPPTANI